MNFERGMLKAIKADVVKGKITVSFKVGMTMTNLDVCSDLARYIELGSAEVDVQITPAQLPLIQVKSFQTAS